MSEAAIDFPQLLREIEDEVRARRAAGDFPPAMERDLDLTFARFAPATVNGDDLAGLIEAAERASYIDPSPVTASRIPVVSLLKKTETKLLGWFFRFVAQQVTAFGGMVVHALRQVQRRIEALEHVTSGADADLLDRVRGSSPVDLSTAAAHLGGATGRVLVAEAGDGSLLRSLADRDAYGVDPSVDRVESAAMAGLDVRTGDVLDHLQGVDAGALGGLALVGIVDRAPLGTQLALVERAAAVLADGARLALVGTSPAAWGATNPVEADLAPGRPLHAATWVHLLEERGFLGVTVVEAGDAFTITAQR